MTTKRPGVLDPVAARYVLPVPPRAAGEVVVVAPRRDHAAVWRRGGEVARVLGERFVALVESQQLFLAELRQRLQELDNAMADATRAQLKGSVRELLGVLEWADAVQVDALREGQLAATGAEPLDVADLCREVAAAEGGPDCPVHVAGEAGSPWWGPAAALAEVVRTGLALLLERVQGAGARRLEVLGDPATVQLWFSGHGEPADAIDAGTIERFRRAVAEVGAAVRPDAHGPGGNGFVIELQRAPRAD